MKRPIFHVFLIVFVVLLSCQKTEDGTSGEDGHGPAEKIRILTTIAPLYSFTVNIAGDAADVENLLASGAGPHDFSLSPMDAKKLNDTDVLIINGVGLETWLDRVIASSDARKTADGKLIVVDTSKGIVTMNNDPHIWLSPLNAVTQVRNISDALIKADPRNSDIYASNAEAYINRLNNLDREISDETKTWSKKEFVALHSAFAYFARDYGLHQAAVVQETPETEPSPKHIASVIKTIKSKKITSIFTETRASYKIINSLASDLGLKVYSLDTLEKGASGSEWYEERMRADLAVFKEALK
ncbi:MAG: zinc ABC transporter substrate-binding protein [Nitrospirota bacterium]